MDDLERLEYKNRFVRQLVQNLETNTEADCNPPQVISGEDNVVILRVSLEEWKKLYSAFYTGADICYPDESDQVRWILQRAVECPVSICELIIECINTNPATRDAIVNMLLGNEGFINGLSKQLGTGSKLSPGEITKPIIAECDEDKLFGAITKIVDYMDTNNRDVFEIIEESTNDEENFALYIGAIPILETIPLDEMIDFAQDITENFAENYASSWTTVYRDEIRCGLFCKARNNPDCTLTFSDIYDYFSERIGATTNIGSALADVINFIRFGSWGGTQVVDAMMLFQVAAWRAGGDFINVSLYSLEAVAQMGAEEPDNDWSILPCPDCPPEGDCEERDYDGVVGGAEGMATGVYVGLGGTIEFTASGTFQSSEGETSYGPNGHPVATNPAFIAPDETLYSLLAKIGPSGEWFKIGESKTVTADTAGEIYINVNEHALAPWNVHIAAYDIEICVDSAPIELVKTAEGFILEPVSSTATEAVYDVETVHTGHAVVFGAFEKNSTVFYVKHVQILTPESIYFDQLTNTNSIGLGEGVVQAYFKYTNIPADFRSTLLGMQGVGPGLRLRFTLTTVPGEEGELVPYTIGAIP